MRICCLENSFYLSESHVFLFTDTASTEFYTSLHTLSLHAALPFFKRIRLYTLVVMLLSSIVSLAIVFATAATLNANGITDIETSAQAAEALLPIAGQFAFALFALGIIGTGLLTVPVLSGSAAYAVTEMSSKTHS